MVKKHVFVTAFLACWVVSSVAEAGTIDWSKLSGHWKATVKYDFKELDKVKFHTPAEQGSEGTLNLKINSEGKLEGDLTLGKAHETWILTDEKYTFIDHEKNYKLTTRSLSHEKVPQWILDRFDKRKASEFLFYEFDSCVLVEKSGTNFVEKPVVCTEGVDIAKGVTHGIWAFSASADRFWNNVYYEYSDTKQKRVIEILFIKSAGVVYNLPAYDTSINSTKNCVSDADVSCKIPVAQK